jgi:hypothetical protein
MMVRSTGAGGFGGMLNFYSVSTQFSIIADRPDVVARGSGQNGLPACTFSIPSGKEPRAAFRACGSATFRDFARSAHFHRPGRVALLSAINNLD